MLAVVFSQWWVLLLLGLLAGTLGGLLGVGGGIIMVPLLVLLLLLPQKAAQGVSLTVMVPLALMAAVNYWRGTHMHVEGLTRSDVFIMAAVMAVGAVAGTFVGSHLSGRLSNNSLRVVFAIFMIIVGVWMLLPKDWISRKPVAQKPAATSTDTPGGASDASAK